MAAKTTLQIGTALVAKHKGQTYRATVDEVEGKAVVKITEGNGFAPAGAVFTSLSAAGQALTQKKACQGPRFWSAAGEGAVAGEKPAKRAPAQPKAKANGKTAEPVEKRTKVIRKAPNQKGIPEGQTRWWCNGCMASFLVEGDAEPEKCPEGHAVYMEVM